ncbi:MAG: CBS domain-containing protein, partial [Candidatus Methanomethyliales bacterium]|nr:CBS domain-containing protein [Candidatus Methanomethylicales archaeon]
MNSENGIGKSYTGIDKGHTPVSKILSRKLVWTTPDASIKSAAELMYKEGVSSVVIIDGNTPLGIITDSDLRRVIAEGLDFNLRLEEFLKQKPKSLPTLVTAEGHENLHEVLSKMIEYRIKHTVVMKSGRPVGVVTIGDIAYSLGPFYIHYVISLRKAKDLEEISRIISEFKEGLTEEALEFSKKPEVGRAGYLFETICHVVDTALKTIVKVKGDIPEGLVYAATGSWGRREQFLLTDRDTLAIYKYHEDKSKVKSFIDRLENYLDEVGLPPCRHGYTARNFIFDFDELLRLVEVWGDDPQKFAVNISLLADARVLVGRSEMLESIKERLVNKLYRNRLLLIQS